MLFILSNSMATIFSPKRDRISELPDDILLGFISSMGMKEAAKTSILSRRWRYLWANRRDLDFHHTLLFPDLGPDPDALCTASQISQYGYWVDQVVDLHCGPCITSFKVSFNFSTYAYSDRYIDKWTRFALSKKVKVLELNLISYSGSVHDMGFDILEPSLGDSGISSLSSLHLRCIDVSGDFIEFLLSQCSLLERLYVESSTKLIRLKVGGISRKLKELTIRYCENLLEFEIDAANLTYFEYFGSNKDTNIVFKSVPMLVEAAFGGFHTVYPFIQRQQFSHVTAQISKLSVDLLLKKIPGGVLPIFHNLKQLILQIHGKMKFELVALTNLLEACPVLRELKLEISWHALAYYQCEAYLLRMLDEFDTNVIVVPEFVHGLFVQQTHPNLKVLYVKGFNGITSDVQLILHLVSYASNLETVICDPTRGINDMSDSEFIPVSRSRAHKLVKLIPSKISVVVI